MKSSAPTLLAAPCLALVACASAPPAVPEALSPGANERAAFTLFARGVQIYECRAAAAGAAPAWSFVAPEAELFEGGAGGAPAGSHGAGPFWQARDGSRTLGKVKSRADAPLAGAIPWLLLSTSAEGPAGRMVPVTSVQRIHTVGGSAPAVGCAAAAELGQRARVPYTADYVFFAAAR